jgi:hypothetical protein
MGSGPLPSWNDGAAKSAMLNLVARDERGRAGLCAARRAHRHLICVSSISSPSVRGDDRGWTRAWREQIPRITLLTAIILLMAGVVAITSMLFNIGPFG